MAGCCENGNGPTVPYIWGNSWVAEKLLASQEDICSMELVHEFDKNVSGCTSVSVFYMS
jgi:hypothetical protein